MNSDWFDRAMAKTTVNQETGCWEFVGSLTHNGYGLIWDEKAQGRGRLHRRSYQEHTGEIPTGMFVCHTCDVRNCWNPEHLFIGTALDNNRDMIAKGRQRYAAPAKRPCIESRRRGEESHFHKLKESEVLLVHSMWAGGEMKKDIAAFFEVNESAIRKILTGETWVRLHPEKSKQFSENRSSPIGERRPSPKTPSSHLQARSHPNQDQRRHTP